MTWHSCWPTSAGRASKERALMNRVFRKYASVIGLAALAAVGCNPGAALMLQDYGRDLLFGGGALAAALYALGVAQNAEQAANIAQDMAQAAQNAPGAPGPQGL